MIPVGWIVLFSYEKKKLRFGFLLRDALLVIELGFKLSVSNAKAALSTPSPQHCSSSEEVSLRCLA